MINSLSGWPILLWPHLLYDLQLNWRLSTLSLRKWRVVTRSSLWPTPATWSAASRCHTTFVRFQRPNFHPIVCEGACGKYSWMPPGDIFQMKLAFIRLGPPQYRCSWLVSRFQTSIISAYPSNLNFCLANPNGLQDAPCLRGLVITTGKKRVLVLNMPLC